MREGRRPPHTPISRAASQLSPASGRPADAPADGKADTGSGLTAKIENFRKTTVNCIILVSIGLAGYALGTEVLRQSVVIDLIQVPKSLNDRGLTAEVATKRLRDEIARIVRESDTSKELGLFVVFSPERDRLRVTETRLLTVPAENKVPEFELSLGGVSLKGVASTLRNLVGKTDTKIAGEIVVDDAITAASTDEKTPQAPARLDLRLRIDGMRIDAGEVESTTNLDTLMERGALQVVDHFDSYLAAAYLFGKQDYAGAKRLLNKCDVTCPKESIKWSLNLKGSIARIAKQYDTAAEFFEQAIKADPEFPLPYYNRAILYVDLGRYDEAVDAVLTGIRFDHDDRTRSIGNANAGLVMFRKEKFDEAMEYFRKSIDQNKKYAVAHYYMGRTLLALDKVKAAREEFETAALHNEKLSEAHNQLGLMDLEEKNWQDALNRFQKAVHLARDVAPYQYNLGRALRYLERFKEAAAAFAETAKMNPKHLRVYAYWGECLATWAYRLKEPDSVSTKNIALKLLKTASEPEFEDGESFERIGAAYEQLGMRAEAIKAYRKAVELDGKRFAHLYDNIRRMADNR